MIAIKIYVRNNNKLDLMGQFFYSPRFSNSYGVDAWALRENGKRTLK